VLLDNLDDADLDEDVVPKQKVEIDNAVCIHSFIERHAKFILNPACSSSHKRDNSARPIITMDRDPRYIVSSSNRGRCR